MKISVIIEQLNAALNKYGDIPVRMNIIGERDCIDIEDIQADEKNVVLYDF